MSDNESNNPDEASATGEAEDPTVDALEAALAELESGMQENSGIGAPVAEPGAEPVAEDDGLPLP